MAPQASVALGTLGCMTHIIETSRETATRHSMFSASAPVLLMVSGGADSIGMLEIFARDTFGSRPLRVLHINHLLRDHESDGDEAFVRAQCERLGVECRTVRYDVAAFAEAGGLNLEDAGRQVRYRFAEDELDAWCQQLGIRPQAGRIAVAHTLDDRIETFFMRAIAGSGTGALGSIAAVRGRIVRPLLDVEREPLRDWLRDQGLSWREDPTNADTSRSRALVRAEILPAAERLNPGFRAALGRTMDLLADDDALLSGMADAFARDFAEITVGAHIVFNREWMRTLDRTMARRTVRSALSEAFPSASRLEAEHVEAMVDGLADDSFARDLPSGLRAVSEYDKLTVFHSDVDDAVVAPGLLSLPGNLEIGAAGSIRAEDVDSGDMSGSADSVVIAADLLAGELTVDGIRPGDRFRPLGMEGSRKVSDLLIDAKVPQRLRRAVPVVRDGDRIVWLAGVRQNDDYRVTPDTERAVRLVWNRPAGFRTGPQ